MEIQENNLNNKLSAIDKALAVAKARKVAKETSSASPDAETPSTPPKAKVKLTDQEKAQKLADRAAKQAQLKAEREERKAAKAKEKASGKPAHMKKIDRAAGKLPSLTASAQLLFNEATTNFSSEQIAAISLHLQHFNRVKATERALGQKLATGMNVRIVSGDPRFIGMTGTVAKAQRIRCYVTIPGVKKDVYCFTSDVEVTEASVSATGTEG